MRKILPLLAILGFGFSAFADTINPTFGPTIINTADGGSALTVNGNVIAPTGTTCTIANSTTCTATVPPGSHCTATVAGIDGGFPVPQCALVGTTLTCTVSANTHAVLNITCE